MEGLPIPAEVIVGFTVPVALARSFWNGDQGLSEDGRRRLSEWLLGLRAVSGHVDWPRRVAETFDRVFGVEHLSLRCFWRSCLASVAAVAVVMALQVGRGKGDQLHAIFSEEKLAFCALFAWNLVIDYVSLLETRTVLRWVERGGVVSGVLIDAAATLGLAIALLVTGAFLLQPPLELAGVTLSHSLSFSAGRWLAAVFLYSTFATSAWLWLYGLAALGIRLLTRAGRTARWLSEVLPVREFPVRATGEVAGVLAFVAYWLSWLYLRLFGA